jgi:uncharacterized protein (TIGR02391 family)
VSARSESRVPQPKPKRFSSLEEVEEAKAKLSRRIVQVKELGTKQVDHESQEAKNVQSSISTTILDIFGPESPEYLENRYFRFFQNQSRAFTDDEEAQEFFQTRGLSDAVSLLEHLIQDLNEQAETLGRGKGRRPQANLEGLELHPRIAEACTQLYRDRHYTDAVLRAALALENYVKEKSGLDLGGSALMEQAFSANNPVIAFNSLADVSDKDEQKGFMLLFQGVVFAFRNPRAHKLLLDDDPDAALEAIGFISFLAKRLERGAVRTR